MKKRDVQLGTKSSSYKLTKDILFKFISDAGHKCFRCGGELYRDDFSIDHKIPWLNEPNAAELFFDLDNIAFSHRHCNYKVARKPHKRLVPMTIEEQRARWAVNVRKLYTPEKRRAKYLKFGY